MASGGHEILIKDAMVFLFAAGVAVPVFRSAKLPAIVGFLLSGIALGPYALGALSETWPILEFISISEPSAAAPFAELGVLFLLFLLGLEFSFEKLWGLRRIVFGVGGLQSGLSTILIAACLMLAGIDAPVALVCGLALALSSTAIVMQLLIDNKLAAQPVGRTGFGVLLFQDVLVAPILIFVGLLSLGSGEQLSTVLLRALLQGILALGILFLIGKFVLRRLFRIVAMAGGRDFLMALTLLTVVGAAAVTASAGLSLALGAFLAGLMLGETEFKHQTEVDLEPFKGILLGLFFMTVGISLNIPAILASPLLILGGVVLLLVIKLIVAFVAVRLFSPDTALSIQAAFLLAPAGEFAFVVFAAAGATGVLVPALSTPLAAIAGITMLILPLMAMIGQRGAAALRRTEPQNPASENIPASEGHVLIAGFGRVGQVIARVLTRESAEVVALDSDAGLVANARDDGLRAYLGDANRREMLHAAGLERAAIFIITVNSPAIVEPIVRTVRTMRPDIPIIARAHDQDHAARLEKAGANFVIPEVVETGLQLAGEALHQFGYDTETVRDRIALERDGEYQRTPKPVETT